MIFSVYLNFGVQWGVQDSIEKRLDLLIIFIFAVFLTENWNEKKSIHNLYKWVPIKLIAVVSKNLVVRFILQNGHFDIVAKDIVMIVADAICLLKRFIQKGPTIIYR
jgi:hypothetical protein